MANQTEGMAPAATAEQMDAMLNSEFMKFDKDKSGYINAVELKELCANLNTVLSDEEISEALKKLDGNNTGNIELFEFKNWWLGKVVFEGQGLGKKLKKVAQSGHRLLGAKLARKQAEADAQLLRNRIALLKQEEAKAWKKIQQTKVRATEILSLREQNERRAAKKDEYAVAEIQQQRKTQEQRYLQKQRDKQLKMKAQAAVIQKRQAEVRDIRKMRRENEIDKQRQRSEDHRRARFNRDVVRSHEEKLKRDKRRKEDEIRTKNQQVYKQRVDLEDMRAQTKENEVARMEKEEMDLIQRLQNAQMLQKEAYEQLEGALSGHNG